MKNGKREHGNKPQLTEKKKKRERRYLQSNGLTLLRKNRIRVTFTVHNLIPNLMSQRRLILERNSGSANQTLQLVLPYTVLTFGLRDVGR